MSETNDEMISGCSVDSLDSIELNSLNNELIARVGIDVGNCDVIEAMSDTTVLNALGKSEDSLDSIELIS